MSAAMKGKKAVPQKAAPKKAVLKKSAPKKATPKPPKRSTIKKQTVLRGPKKVENLRAGGEVRRKFAMTVEVSGYEFLADPVAATRRVLILALTKIPAKIHEEQIDNGSLFNGILNDPKDPSAADLHSPNMWQWQPANR